MTDSKNYLIWGIDVIAKLNSAKLKKQMIGYKLLYSENLEQMVLENPEMIFGYPQLSRNICEYKNKADLSVGGMIQ